MSGIESWSTTPANNNQAPPFGWPAGILPSQVEPIGRQMMTSLAAWYQAAEWINYNFPIVYSSATVFTISTNVTALYHVGRRVQATDGSTSVFGTITASVFTSLTTVTVVWDTGVLQTGVTIVYVGITSKVNTSAPIQALTSAAFANPSASIGLTAVNGVATTAMRADASQALDQTISPTMAGTWTFSNAITVNGAGSSLKGGVTVVAPASGVAVTVNGSGANVNTVAINSAQGSSGGAGDLVINRAGSTVNTVGSGPNITLNDSTAITDTLLQHAGGQTELWQFNGGSWNQILRVLTTRGVNVNAPASGTTLTANGPAGGHVVDLISGTAGNVSQDDLRINRAGSTANAVQQGPNLTFADTANSTFTALQNSGGQTELWQFNGSWGQVLKVGTTRSVTINAASSGSTLTVAGGGAGTTALAVNSGQGAAGNAGDIVVNRAGSTVNTVGEGPNITLNDSSATTDTLLQHAGGQTELWQFNGSWNQILKVLTTRGVVINLPSSGNALTVTGAANADAILVTASSTSGQAFGLTVRGGTTSADYGLRVFNQANSVQYFGVRGDGVVQGNDGTSLFELGYKDIPQNLQTANYSPALSDRGKGVDFNGTSLTCTIPANASVAFPIGATLVITNLNASNLSIAITTDTLILAGTVTVGTRTLAANGVATARKVAATSWIISGAGLS